MVSTFKLYQIMLIEKTELDGIIILEPVVYYDNRGSFYESFNAQTFKEDTGIEVTFVQDNHSTSFKGVVRGLHYQTPHAQGKLIRVIRGTIYDVVVDIRKDSKTFGKWISVELSAENRKQLWIPPGFAHGFQALTDIVEFNYKVTDYRYKECEHSIRWNDPTLDIYWPLPNPILSEKDNISPLFTEINF